MGTERCPAELELFYKCESFGTAGSETEQEEGFQGLLGKMSNEE
jgi:hypothetical protein